MVALSDRLPSTQAGVTVQSDQSSTWTGPH